MADDDRRAIGDPVRWARARGLLVRTLGPDEELVLRPNSPAGVVELSGTARFVWREITSPITIGELAERAASAYGVDLDGTVDDIARTVDLLAEAGIVGTV